jgi:hypothetical protein
LPDDGLIGLKHVTTEKIKCDFNDILGNLNVIVMTF